MQTRTRKTAFNIKINEKRRSDFHPITLSIFARESQDKK
jgi:hypothetical protein